MGYDLLQRNVDCLLCVQIPSLQKTKVLPDFKKELTECWHTLRRTMQSSIYRINTRNRTKTKLQGHLPYIISSARYDAHTHRVWIGTYNAGLCSMILSIKCSGKLRFHNFRNLLCGIF